MAKSPNPKLTPKFPKSWGKSQTGRALGMGPFRRTNRSEKCSTWALYSTGADVVWTGAGVDYLCRVAQVCLC